MMDFAAAGKAMVETSEVLKVRLANVETLLAILVLQNYELHGVPQRLAIQTYLQRLLERLETEGTGNEPVDH